MDYVLLDIYKKIYNNDLQVTPEELKFMLNEINLKDIDDSSEYDKSLYLLSILDIIHSFYSLGYNSKSKKRYPISP